MSIDLKLRDLIKKHNKLEAIDFPSDKQIEELLQVKEEIKLILQDQIHDMSYEIDGLPPKVFESPKPRQINPGKNYNNEELAEMYLKDHPEERPKEIIQPKKKLTIFQYIMKRRAEKRELEKATLENIAQLRLEDRKAFLEARIAVNKKKANENKPRRFSFLHNVLPQKIFKDESGSDGSFNGKIFTEKSERGYKADKKAVFKEHSDRDYSVLTGKKKDFKL